MSLISVLGEKIITYLVYRDSNFAKSTKDLSKAKIPNINSSFTCHLWVSDKNMNESKIVIANEVGEIFLLDANCEYKITLKQINNEGSINSLQSWSKGFIAGGQGGRI